MEKPTHEDMRLALESASLLSKAGILFVPMPVMSVEDRDDLLQEAYGRVCLIIKKIKGNEAATRKMECGECDCIGGGENSSVGEFEAKI